MPPPVQKTNGCFYATILKNNKQHRHSRVDGNPSETDATHYLK